MVLQNYQNFIEMTSNIIYIVALGVGLKCPRKIYFSTQCPPSKSAYVMYEWYLLVGDYGGNGLVGRIDSVHEIFDRASGHH